MGLATRQAQEERPCEDRKRQARLHLQDRRLPRQSLHLQELRLLNGTGRAWEGAARLCCGGLQVGSVFARINYRTMGSSTDPLSVPKRRPCRRTASLSVRVARQSATKRGALPSFMSQR